MPPEWSGEGKLRKIWEHPPLLWRTRKRCFTMGKRAHFGTDALTSKLIPPTQKLLPSWSSRNVLGSWSRAPFFLLFYPNFCEQKPKDLHHCCITRTQTLTRARKLKLLLPRCSKILYFKFGKKPLCKLGFVPSIKLYLYIKSQKKNLFFFNIFLISHRSLA